MVVAASQGGIFDCAVRINQQMHRKILGEMNHNEFIRQGFIY